MKSPYELRANDEDEEGGAAPSDDDEGSDAKSDSGSDRSSNDSGCGDDVATVIVRATTVKTMIANTVAMTRANSPVIGKMKTQIFSMKNMMMMWTTMMKILKLMSNLTSGVTLIVTITG